MEGLSNNHTGVQVADGNLVANGTVVLSNVGSGITVNCDVGKSNVPGLFLGATCAEEKSHHVVPIGTLTGLRFVACFRFKLWWMTQRMGTVGREIPLETQFLLIESNSNSSKEEEEGSMPASGSTTYTVFLPLLDGAFRACLQGNEKNELELCLESGDPDVRTKVAYHSIYVHCGSVPFKVISDAVRAAEEHTQSFVRREKKELPGILDYFGWCTWDAFYKDVTADGVSQGLTTLEAGGTPPGFLIIDDGWQSTIQDSVTEGINTAGAQPAHRLFSLKANHKFQKDGKPVLAPLEEGVASGLRDIVIEAKQRHNLKYVYVWHALTGYWGGVLPCASGMEHLRTKMTYPVHSPGILDNDPLMAGDDLTINGLGLVHPEKAFAFFDELHTYLASAGVDGVKVDVQGIIETLGTGYGGRVALAKMYHEALEESVRKNFPENGCIACMSHSSDSVLSSKQTALIRASDDFWPRDAASHTIHIASVAYNSLFLGEFMQPDWDMFHSKHSAAEYHAAARAVGGCAIYVSDKPGEHNFELLKKLVLPDRTVLRARLPGRPTRDSLFNDPARDGASMLKIWNHNDCNGVVAAFNCQGAGWCRIGKTNKIHDTAPKSVSSRVTAADVEGIAGLAGPGWNGDVLIFSHCGRQLKVVKRTESIPITLGSLQFEIFTVSPVKQLKEGKSFAPIGLTRMYNSGGAILSVNYEAEEQDDGLAAVTMSVRGCGEFSAYSSTQPQKCSIDDASVDFQFDATTGHVIFELPVPKPECKWVVKIEL